MQSTTDSIQTLKKSTRGRRAARRGVSLLEVLIVLVILVVGILAVIRLFPSGFFSVNSAGNAGLADSLGSQAVAATTQGLSGLPDAILPGTDLTMPASNSNYDPDDPNTLENARIVSNETITVPSQTVGGAAKCVYPVRYGPIVMGVDPTQSNFTQMPKYLTVNSAPWQTVSGDFTTTVGRPQDSLTPGRPTFLVDLTNKRVAVPYAPYTSTGAATANSYDQKMVAMIFGSDDKVYTEYLDVPQATPKGTANPNAPFQTDNVTYLADTSSNYQGGWFDPTATYPDTADYPVTAQTVVPPAVSWTRVILFRPFQPMSSAGTFGADPYEFKLPNPNIGGANIGAIAFNPFAAGGNGVPALTAQVSYQTYHWDILREDHDIPTLLSSSGQTSVQRLTLKNIERYNDTLPAGEQQPGMTKFPGLIPTSTGHESILILDLNTGLLLPQDDINDADRNGPSVNKIDFSAGLGRLIFPALLNGNVAPPRRARIFYAAEGDWTVAVQKAPRYYTPLPFTSGTDPNIGSAQFVFDSSSNSVYFPRSDAGKTVEIDGTYTDSNGGTRSFSDAVAISGVSPTTPTLADYRAVNLADSSISPAPIPAGATNVTFTSVRGLSARAVVAWKERSQWKVHRVDTILTHPQ